MIRKIESSMLVTEVFNDAVKGIATYGDKDGIIITAEVVVDVPVPEVEEIDVGSLVRVRCYVTESNILYVAPHYLSIVEQ